MINYSLLIVEKYPIIGVFTSIIILFGFYELGIHIFKIKILKGVFKDLCSQKYLNIFISTNFFLIIVYPLLLLFNLKIFFYFASFLIFFLGLKRIIQKLYSQKISLKIDIFDKKFFTFSLKLFDKYLFFFLIFLYFLLSLSPITHSDALGYHLSAALSILDNGSYPYSLFHFHSFLTGAGEIFIAMGLLFGSEQFANLIQLISLLPIIGIIKKISKKNYFYLLLIVIAPTIVFLVSASKPQLFFACSNFVIFYLFIEDFTKPKFQTNKSLFVKYFVSSLILIISLHGKFSFLLSSGIIGLLILGNSINRKKYLIFFSSTLLALTILYFPVIYWKIINFGGYFFNHIFTAIPNNIEGSEKFLLYLSDYKRHESFLYIIFPKQIGDITYSMGLSSLYFLFIYLIKDKDKKLYIILGSIFLFIMVVILKGQVVARFLIEPYFWLILILAKYKFHKKILILDFLSRGQGLILIPILFYGIFTLSIGSLSPNLRESVLEKTANGYSLFKWANLHLKKNDIVISVHRSIGFAKFKVISDGFVSWVNLKDKNTLDIYNKLLEDNSPKYIIGEKKYIMMRYKKCLGKLVKEGVNVNNHATRNPFNATKNKTNGYIYEFNLKKFPNCVEQ